MKYVPYIPKKAVMIDAETLDKIPSSVVLSFAGLIFEPLGCKQQLVDADEKVIAPNINIVFEYTETQAHRSKSPSTIQWWAEQSAAARAGVFSDKLLRVDYETAVRRFYDWLAYAKSQGAEAIFACCSRSCASRMRATSTDIACALFLCWLRPSWQVTTVPVGR